MDLIDKIHGNMVNAGKQSTIYLTLSLTLSVIVIALLQDTLIIADKISFWGIEIHVNDGILIFYLITALSISYICGFSMMTLQSRIERVFKRLAQNSCNDRLTEEEWKECIGYTGIIDVFISRYVSGEPNWRNLFGVVFVISVVGLISLTPLIACIAGLIHFHQMQGIQWWMYGIDIFLLIGMLFYLYRSMKVGFTT